MLRAMRMPVHEEATFNLTTKRDAHPDFLVRVVGAVANDGLLAGSRFCNREPAIPRTINSKPITPSNLKGQTYFS